MCFNQCVTTSHIHPNYLSKHLATPPNNLKGGFAPLTPPCLAAGYSPQYSLRPHTYSSALQFYCEDTKAQLFFPETAFSGVWTFSRQPYPGKDKFKILLCRGLAPPQISPPRRPLEDTFIIWRCSIF